MNGRRELDGRRLAELAAAGELAGLHEYLAGALELPPYYGRNLDALYDLLTEAGGCRVVLSHSQALEATGGYGARLLATLQEAAAANPGFALKLISD